MFTDGKQLKEYLEKGKGLQDEDKAMAGTSRHPIKGGSRKLFQAMKCLECHQVVKKSGKPSQNRVSQQKDGH